MPKWRCAVCAEDIYKKNVKVLIHNLKNQLHIEMILFWIDWVK